MDPFVADPDWGHWIIAYFFLGGIAAGSYATARFLDLFGAEDDRPVARIADLIALPLVSVCGVFLIVDLGRPERFWHMLLKSETLGPMLKPWSPMSAGSWGLSAFGAFAFGSFLLALAEEDHFGLGRWKGALGRLRHGWTGRLYAMGGLLSAFFLGSYTGALLSATNQPAWADSTWLAPLFLASASSTGLASMVLIARWQRSTPDGSLHRLERADDLSMALEIALLIAFALSLGEFAPAAFGQWPGVLIPAFVAPVGLLLPIALKRFAPRNSASIAAGLVLLGGLVLRAAIVGMPAALRVGAS